METQCIRKPGTRTDPEIVRQYRKMRGCSDDELVRSKPKPQQWVTEAKMLISYQDAVDVYGVTRDKLRYLNLNGKINRVILEKGQNKRRVFFYIEELDEVLKRC